MTKVFDLSKFNEYREDNRKEGKRWPADFSLGYIFCLC